MAPLCIFSFSFFSFIFLGGGEVSFKAHGTVGSTEPVRAQIQREQTLERSDESF